jgi:hypothetical protein
MSAMRGSGRWVSILGIMLAGTMLGAAPARAQNVAPVISGTPATSAQSGKSYDFRPVASDANGDRLRFSASTTPRWARFDGKTGRLYGTPAQRDVGQSHAITISVSDGKLTASLPRFTLQVTASGAAPTISGVPATSAREAELYGFVPAASDPDGDALKFSIANKPAWATFTTSTGLLSGIPPVGSAGTHANITISVTDGQTSSALAPFSITVNSAPNQPPSIWGVPATSAQVGQSYAFKPNASDPEGQKLLFSIHGLPGWATFDTATGALGGMPSVTYAGTSSNVTISVTDGQASASLAPFAIEVIASNLPPTISGVPSGTAKVGQAYSFTPTAKDPEGQKLTFSIANRPAWAQFDTATGRLYGTPGDANVGSHSNIQIAVSDGQYSAALPAFSITVQKPVSGNAALSWVPPTSNVDGTPITNLAGYRIAYGQYASNLAQSLDIPSPGITSAVIENLAAGTWYFAVKAYTTANVESDLSNLAQKTVL